MNNVIETHFRENYDDLVRKFTQSTVDKSEASAEDIVMEAYRRAVQYHPSVRGSVKDFDGWFFRICLNCLSDSFKEARNTEEHKEFIEEEHESSFSEDFYDLDKRYRILEERIDLEPEQYRDILRYYYINRLKMREVSEIIPYSIPHIGRIVKKFHEATRKWVDEENIRI